MDAQLAGAKLWPEGETRLHVYVIPTLTQQLKELIQIYREVMDDFPFISQVPDDLLHVSVQMIDSKPTADFENNEVTSLLSALFNEMRKIEPFTMTVGPAMAGQYGVTLDLTPDAKFRRMADGVRSAITRALEVPPTYRHGRPHIALGYGTRCGDSGVATSRLRGATDMRVPLIVTGVVLANVGQDTDAHLYRRHDWGRVPLGQPGTVVTNASC